MTEITALLSSVAPGAIRAPATIAAAPRFSLLLTGISAPTEHARQSVAENGKPLPVEHAETPLSADARLIPDPATLDIVPPALPDTVAPPPPAPSIAHDPAPTTPAIRSPFEIVADARHSLAPIVAGATESDEPAPVDAPAANPESTEDPAVRVEAVAAAPLLPQAPPLAKRPPAADPPPRALEGDRTAAMPAAPETPARGDAVTLPSLSRADPDVKTIAAAPAAPAIQSRTLAGSTFAPAAAIPGPDKAAPSAPTPSTAPSPIAPAPLDKAPAAPRPGHVPPPIATPLPIMPARSDAPAPVAPDAIGALPARPAHPIAHGAPDIAVPILAPAIANLPAARISVPVAPAATLPVRPDVPGKAVPIDTPHPAPIPAPVATNFPVTAAAEIAEQPGPHPVPPLATPSMVMPGASVSHAVEPIPGTPPQTAPVATPYRPPAVPDLPVTTAAADIVEQPTPPLAAPLPSAVMPNAPVAHAATIAAEPMPTTSPPIASVSAATVIPVKPRIVFPAPSVSRPVATNLSIEPAIAAPTAISPRTEPTILPAAQAFAGALFAAVESARPKPATAPGNVAELAMIAGIDLSSSASAPVAQASATASAAILDTSHADWLDGMIDEIEMLTATAGVERRETRIRLNPDQLGSVEIAIERDGETTNLRFTAETQATRMLLAEAAPRLAELADARGLKLGQAHVDLGGSAAHSNSQQRNPDARAEPNRPATALSAEAADDAAQSTHRIA